MSEIRDRKFEVGIGKVLTRCPKYNLLPDPCNLIPISYIMPGIPMPPMPPIPIPPMPPIPMSPPMP